MKRRQIIILLVAAVIVVTKLTAGQTTRIAKVLDALRSPDPTVRESGLKRLAEIPTWATQTEIRKAVVDTLVKENAIISSAYRENHPVGEDYAEYVARLAETVTGFAAEPGEQRALDALVHAPYNPDSRFAEWLGTLGDAVVPSVMDLAQSDLGVDRAEALGLIRELLRQDRNGPRLSAANDRTLKETVRKAARDISPLARQTAVHSLGLVADPEDMRLLYEIAGSDPSVDSTSGSFPIREEAQKSLEKIRQRLSSFSLKSVTHDRKLSLSPTSLA